MGFIDGKGDGPDAFDLFVFNELDKQNKQSGGCMLSLLLMLALPALLAAGAIVYFR